MPNNAAVGSVVGAVAVVAVVCAVAAITNTKKASDDPGLSANVKLSSVCSVTRYPGRCEQSLGPVVNDTSDPESVLRAALQVALDEVAGAFERSGHVVKEENDKMTKNAMEACKKLLNDSRDDLRGMASLNPEQVTEHVTDLRTWLSGVMTYIYTCADGFDKPELKEAMDKVLQNSTELSSNALAIITRLGELMPDHGPPKSNGSTGANRRLLGWQGSEAADEGSMRRLLAVHDKVAELTDVKDASRQLLSDTLDAITEMSHDVSRRLLGLTSTDVPNDTAADGDLPGRRHVDFDADSTNSTPDDVPGGERRHLSVSFNDAASTKTASDAPGGERRHLDFTFGDSDLGEPTPDVSGGERRHSSADSNSSLNFHLHVSDGERRQLSTLLSAISNMTTQAEDAKHRLLSIPSNDWSDAIEHDGGGRAVLSHQLESIANMSAEMQRLLLAAELPDDLAGMRQVLSSTLMALKEATTDAKGQLDSIENGTPPSNPERALNEEVDERHKPHYRLLTTNVIGTIDEIEDEGRRHTAPPTPPRSGEFPEWVPSHTRRLLQRSGNQKPNTVVAKDGSGNFKTITEAINAAPKNSPTRFAIYVKAGEYNEYVTIPKELPNIFMYGDGPSRTRVIGNKSNKDGVPTIASRTFCKYRSDQFP
ncbi:hypothetical protein GUJ93_ZPchr0458g22486 [Zizania palustris]|uniref:Pectinesterase inhibitor domain-containing protein n=1 Tax=Zizania palustris TaxID=103762 RepID=A0A8J5RE38_ZIZPA|nr:hypothetical protein GUJ93_ZPchr0458g22486 [Zizania palustris]